MDTRLFEAKPEVMGGKLCFRRTRLPVKMILDVIDAGWDDASILSQFPSLPADALAEARRQATDPEGGWVRSRVA